MKLNNTKTKEITVALPQALVTKVKIYCARRGLKIKLWVRAVVEQGLKEGK